MIFAIRKTDVNLNWEKDAIVKEFLPYYKKNESSRVENIGEKVKDEYNQYRSHVKWL